MTREAKIGMLTGLGVIVLIGVLLSNYLGGGAGAAGMSPTGRMAELPMGAAYRQEMTEPVGVPGMARGNAAGAGAPVAAAPALPASSMTTAGPVASGSPSMPEPVKGATGPIVGQSVTPVPAGQIQMDQPLGDGAVPTLQLTDGSNGASGNGPGTEAVYVPGQSKPVATGTLTFNGTPVAPAAPVVKGLEYVIAPGDTLGRIATKFYKSSQSDAVNRIVAANPKVLKDSKTMLIAGKKLIIPTVATAVKPATAAAVATTNGKKAAVVVIHPPGSAAVAKGPASAVTDTPKKGVSTVYVVQSGDTLEKIAKRIAPSSVGDMVKKLEAMNGISDPTGLKIGQKLKLPAAKAV